MARILVIEPSDDFARLLVQRLSESPAVEACRRAPPGEGEGVGPPADLGVDTVVYSPRPGKPGQPTPDLRDAEAVFSRCALATVRHVVVLSSAAVYAPSHRNRGLLSEAGVETRNRRNRIAE